MQINYGIYDFILAKANPSSRIFRRACELHKTWLVNCNSHFRGSGN